MNVALILDVSRKTNPYTENSLNPVTEGQYTLSPGSAFWRPLVDEGIRGLCRLGGFGRVAMIGGGTVLGILWQAL